MAKVKSPLLSIGAKGQLGKSMVFAAWRGVDYARQHVVPQNPRTTAQTTTRNTFSSIDAQWKRLGALSRAVWTAATKSKPLIDRNLFIKANLPQLRGQANMNLFTASPGYAGGLPPTSISATAGATAGDIDVTVGTPTEPIGWTLDAVICSAFPDRDPATPPTTFVQEAQDSSPTAGSDSTVTVSGLPSGTSCQVSAWTQWTRTDGTTAYGESLITQASSA